MTEETEKQPTINYSSNSKNKKDVAPSPKAKRVASPIVTEGGIQHKKSTGRKFREAFIGDNVDSVGDYVMFDVIIPAIKSMLSDAISMGSDRFFFGSARGGSRSSSSGYRSGHTSYSNMYRGGNDRREPQRELTRSEKANHDFRDIIIDNRGEAEEVLGKLVDIIREYGVTSVEDFYDCIGQPSNFVDTQWGWDDLRDADIRRTGNGYRIDFPRPIHLD